MSKETKLIIVIILVFIFSTQLIVEKSYQSIFPNIGGENNNNYFGNLKIIEKNADVKEEKEKKETSSVVDEQIPIKPSESYNNKSDGKTIIENEIKEGNTNLKIINSNMNKNQNNESILKIQ